MQAAARQAPPGQGHVQRFGRQLAIQLGLLQGVAAGFQCRLDRLLGLVDAGASGLAFLGGHAAQALQQFGQLATLAEVAGLDLLQRRQVGADIDRIEGVGNDFVWIAHERVTSLEFIREGREGTRRLT